MLSIENLVFYEQINLSKLKYVKLNENDFKEQIQAEEKKMRRLEKNKKYHASAVFQKIIDNTIVPPELEGTELGYIKVSYTKGTNSNNEGRWYANKSIGLAPLCCCVRHTICDGIWTDIDQVNSHPTIFKQFMDKLGYESKCLNDCLNDREEFLQNLKDELKISRDDAKEKVISIINGGSPGKSVILEKLQKEISPCVEKIVKSDEYKYILDYIEANYPDEKNKYGKTISRILQNIENNLLETYIKFFNDKGYINKIIINGQEGYEVVLIFDGFQIRSLHNIDDEILNECRIYAKEQCGYDIQLKIKPFDNPLPLPENYIIQLDEIPAMIDKIKGQLLDKYDDMILNLIKKRTNDDIAKCVQVILKDKLVYDSHSKKWFCCNTHNIWKEYDLPYIINHVLSDILPVLINKPMQKFIQRAFDTNLTDEERKTASNQAKDCIALIKNLKSTSMLNNIPKHNHLFMKEYFKQDYLDTNAHLFAFSNKVFDFEEKTLRPIKPTDYILTNTGYDYPEYDCEDDRKFIQEYFNTLFPDAELKDYVLDVFATCLNGANEEQHFFIHTGSGSNAKTSTMDMVYNAFGNYSVELSPEQFTQPPKANGNNELFKVKGKRWCGFNEPDDDNGNKIQTATMKKFAETSNGTITGKDLYQSPITFKNQATLHGCMNNKPTLSTVDGGIARRIRIIDYKVKFVSNPNSDNQYEKPLDSSIKTKLNTKEIRNTFIRILLKRWEDNVSEVDIIKIPASVQKSTDDYIADCNSVLGFISEIYEITNQNKDRVGPRDLYIEYKSWLQNNNPMSDKKFKEYLTNMGIKTDGKSNGKRYYAGLKKRLETNTDSPEIPAGAGSDEDDTESFI